MLGLGAKPSEEQPLILEPQIEAKAELLLCLDCSVNNIALSSGSVRQIPEIFLAQLNENLWFQFPPIIDSAFENTNYHLGFESLDQKQTQNGITLQLRIHVTIKNPTTASTLQSEQAQILEKLSIAVENFMNRTARERRIVFKGIDTMVWFAKSPPLGTVVADEAIWNAEPFPGLTRSSKNYNSPLQQPPAQPTGSGINPPPTVSRGPGSPAMFPEPPPPQNEPTKTPKKYCP